MFIKTNNYFGPFDVGDNSDSDLWMLTLRSPGIERRTCNPRLWVRIPAPAGSVHDWDPWARHRTPNCSPAPMFFFLLLIVQFLETKITNQCIIYSQKLYLIFPDFSVTLHLKVFCLNKHVFVISYVHLGFMLHHLLFNESSLHYLSIMCVCMNDSVHLLYISIYFCLWWNYLWWASLLPPALLWWLSVCYRYKTDFNSSVCFWI